MASLAVAGPYFGLRFTQHAFTLHVHVYVYVYVHVSRNSKDPIILTADCVFAARRSCVPYYSSTHLRTQLTTLKPKYYTRNVVKLKSSLNLILKSAGTAALLPVSFAPDADRLQWVRNGLTLFTANDYNSKVLSERGGAGQRCRLYKNRPAGFTQQNNSESPRITEDCEQGSD